MDWFIPLAAIAGGILAGAMSPGPSFVVVARTALASSRLNGLAAALGMGAGGALFALAAVLGLVLALQGVPMLWLVFKILGALYLLFLAMKMWTASRLPLVFAPAGAVRRVPLRRSFIAGFATQISNPKTAVVYASIFAAALPGTMPRGFAAECVGLIFLIEAGWYSVVALVFSADGPRQRYLASKAVFVRLAASSMGILGLKILSEAR